MRKQIKEHFETHRELYIGIGVAVITSLVMRGIASQHISRGIPVTTSPGIPGTGESVVLNNASKTFLGKSIILNSVSYIASERQGPPSWVIRCKETNVLFTSQRSAALEMGIPENELSRHLNGVLDHVRGYQFERICMAV